MAFFCAVFFAATGAALPPPVHAAPPGAARGGPEDTGIAVNTLGMEFVLVPAGVFVMGDLEGEDDEAPLREVTLTRDFRLGRHEVTQRQFELVTGRNPSVFPGPDNPVDSVSWEDAREFVSLLNAREGTRKYRLPTEAEWEHAARGGTRSRFFFGDDTSLLGRYDWVRSNSGGVTHPVGTKDPGPYGLFDMHGNVGEWVEDRYGYHHYAEARRVEDPTGPASGTERVVRGGSRHDDPFHARPADRLGSDPAEVPEEIRGSYGFRVAYFPEPVKKSLFGRGKGRR
jgi:formylglycine-generating enzyme required for sulfatase activity